MNFKELKQKVKQEQKELAKKIRLGKFCRKPKNAKSSKDRDLASATWYNGYLYRHTHIVYCQLFNKTPYEKIEKSCREEPSEKLLLKIENEIKSQLDETIHSDS